MTTNKIVIDWIKNYQNLTKYKNKKQLNKIFNLVINNEWSYFFIFKSFTKNQNLQNEWKNFRQKIQYYIPKIKILAIPNLNYYYGVIGNADLNYVLARAVNQQQFRKDLNGQIMLDKNGEPIPNEFYLQRLETELGDNVYCFRPKIYKNGLCYAIKIKNENQNMSIFDKILFYLTKHLKNQEINLNKKSFFHTLNLNVSNNFQISNIENQLLLQIFKNLNNTTKEKVTSYINGLITM